MAVRWTKAQKKAFLTAMGFNSRFFAINTLDFQRAYNLGPGLKTDRKFGPLTTAAAVKVLQRGGMISPHFNVKEFWCGCGRQMHHRLRLHRNLLRGLEDLREKAYPNGLPIVSGYRDTRWNKRVGGIVGSNHTRGLAADIPRKIFPNQWPDGVRYLSEIGYKRTHGKITHVGVDDKPRRFFAE